MIVWLNEAAGEDPRLIHAAIVAAQERVNTHAEARYARNRPYCANVTNRSQPIVIVPAASERK
jgi:hypothetical protein